MLIITAVLYLFLKISSAVRKYGKPLKSSDLVIYEKKRKPSAFSIFPESSKSVCAGTYQSNLWTRCTCAKDRNNADLCLEVLCAWAKDVKQKKFL